MLYARYNTTFIEDEKLKNLEDLKYDLIKAGNSFAGAKFKLKLQEFDTKLRFGFDNPKKLRKQLDKAFRQYIKSVRIEPIDSELESMYEERVKNVIAL